MLLGIYDPRLKSWAIIAFGNGRNNIYEKCCVSIDGHSSPSLIHNTPSIEVLREDYTQFKSIRSNFT